MKIRKLPVAISNELGIEDLKLLLIFLFEIIARLRSVIAKFDFIAAFGLVQEIYINRSLFQRDNLNIVLAQIRDLVPTEAQELSEFFNLEFDIPNDELELRIEQGVGFIPRGYTLILENLNFGGEIVDWFNSFGELREVSPTAVIKLLPKDLQTAVAN